MATNHTENYDLSQWLATDYVVREDFNSDNLKIDTALHTIAQSIAGTGKIRLLYEKTHTTQGYSVLFSFPDLDLSQYKIIIVDIDAVAEDDNDIYFLLNNSASCSFYSWGNATATEGYCGKLNADAGGANRIVLFSPFGGEYPISLLNFPTGTACEFGISSSTFSTLHSIALVSSIASGGVDRGAKMKIWGIE